MTRRPAFLLLDYYAASADTNAAVSIDVFADVFGDPFADVEAEYLAGGLPATSGSLECDGPDVSWDGATWEHTFRLSCDEPGSIGPQRSEDDAGSYLWSKVTMTAPTGWTSLQLDASGPTLARVVRRPDRRWPALAAGRRARRRHRPMLGRRVGRRAELSALTRRRA